MYDDTLFHRIIPDYVVQGGGYDQQYNEKPSFDTIFNESGNGLKNSHYSIAMARTSDPHSANRQFFINVADNQYLDPGKNWGYAVFGSVIEGYKVVDKMALVTTEYFETTGWNDVPVEPVILKKATIVPKR
jgi:peptidyl-prolyl cis-trans isomerase A (cyclophilin A)